RPQRRRQDDADQADAWADASRLRLRAGARRGPIVAGGAARPTGDRLSPGERRLPGLAHWAGDAAVLWPPEAPAGGGVRSPVGAGRPDGGGAQAHRPLLEGHAPAARPRPGAARRAAPAVPGRADDRPRPVPAPELLRDRREAARAR